MWTQGVGGRQTIMALTWHALRIGASESRKPTHVQRAGFTGRRKDERGQEPAEAQKDPRGPRTAKLNRAELARVSGRDCKWGSAVTSSAPRTHVAAWSVGVLRSPWALARAFYLK